MTKSYQTIFTNQQVADLLKVSNTTVLNWILAAQSGKNNLQLQSHRKKVRIVRNQHNLSELNMLKEKANIYRNKITLVHSQISDSFYKNLATEEQIELFTNLESGYNIPNKFAYKEYALSAWEEHLKDKEGYYTVPAIQGFWGNLETVIPILNDLTASWKEVSLVTLGGLNPCLSIQPLLKDWTVKNKSFNLATIQFGFGLDQVGTNTFSTRKVQPKFQTFIKDFEKNNIGPNLLSLSKSQTESNLVFLPLDQINSFEKPVEDLRNIVNSLSSGDYLIISAELDTSFRRAIFDFSVERRNPFLTTLEVLGFQVDQMELRKEFSSNLKERQTYLKMDKDYHIAFNIQNQLREINIIKSEEIKFWKSRLYSLREMIEIMENAGLRIINTTINRKEESLLAITRRRKAVDNY